MTNCGCCGYPIGQPTAGMNVPLMDFTKKERMLGYYTRYFLSKTAQMFEWENLPDNITKRDLELLLQYNGAAIFYQREGHLWATFGGLGGEPAQNYMPTIATIANPAQNYSANLKIGKECIVIPNDTFYMGLMPLIRRYATIMTECDISLNNVAELNLRLPAILTANTDNGEASARRIVKGIIEGKPEIIGRVQDYMSEVKDLGFQPFAATAGLVQDIIEARQYCLAQLYTELGLKMNHNMKREALNEEETSMGDDVLFPYVDDMLAARQNGCELVNNLFGTDIRVKLASSWEDNAEQAEAELDILENEAEETSEEQPTESEEAVEDGET